MLEGYNGYVVCDGYTGYDFLGFKGIKVQRCWVHIRRYFYDCIKTLKKENQSKAEAYEVFNLINKLFKYESDFLEKCKTKDEIVNSRNSKDYLDTLEKIDNEVERLDKLPKKGSNLTKAILYYQNIKAKNELTTFLEDGELEIDNNIAERTVKPFVIGRKNFLFCKTELGAETTSELYSIVQSAINNGINVEKYIKYVLENIDKVSIEKLVPWNDEIQKKFGIVTR